MGYTTKFGFSRTKEVNVERIAWREISKHYFVCSDCNEYDDEPQVITMVAFLAMILGNCMHILTRVSKISVTRDQPEPQTQTQAQAQAQAQAQIQSHGPKEQKCEMKIPENFDAEEHFENFEDDDDVGMFSPYELFDVLAHFLRILSAVNDSCPQCEQRTLLYHRIVDEFDPRNDTFIIKCQNCNTEPDFLCTLRDDSNRRISLPRVWHKGMPAKNTDTIEIIRYLIKVITSPSLLGGHRDYFDQMIERECDNDDLISHSRILAAVPSRGYFYLCFRKS